ncbi:hypothetical protein XENTR_v10006500 [Xenopus tropicalis]|nr:hypothetical protein XENTR_v10006500 [Xenopus tropicalis]
MGLGLLPALEGRTCRQATGSIRKEGVSLSLMATQSPVHTDRHKPTTGHTKAHRYTYPYTLWHPTCTDRNT